MKNIKKIVVLALLMLVFTTCRKEIKEPPSDTRNDNYVYIEIDGEKFMVEDRSWNYNKNTMGSFNSESIYISFSNDSNIYISFNCENEKNDKRNKNYPYLSTGMLKFLSLSGEKSSALSANFTRWKKRITSTV